MLVNFQQEVPGISITVRHAFKPFDFINKLPRSRAARYLTMALLIYSIKQFQLASKYLAILFPLLGNIVFYHFFIPILSNGIHIISACPKLPTPQLLIHLRMSSKYLFCRYTFCYLYYSLRKHRWHALNQKMNMIFITANLYIVYFVSFTYSQAGLFKSLFHSFREHISSIFRWTNHMVQQYSLVVPFDNMFAHQPYSNTYPGASSEEFF